MSRKPAPVEQPAAPAKPLCFVIGPIGERGTPIHKLANFLLKGVFKPVLEADEFGYHVKRADEDASPGSIATAVILDVINADLVVADLTGFNPNAFYELGLRHMTGKPTIHVIAEQVRLPFDNADQRTIFIDVTDFDEIEASKAALASMVRAVHAEGFKVSNPVTQAQGMLALENSGDSRDQLIAELGSRLSDVEQRLRTSVAASQMSTYQPPSYTPFTLSDLAKKDAYNLLRKHLDDSMTETDRAAMSKLMIAFPPPKP